MQPVTLYISLYREGRGREGKDRKEVEGGKRRWRNITCERAAWYIHK